MEHDPSFLDTLEKTFRLLVSSPAPLAVDGRGVHPKLPARPIPLDELRTILLEETTSFAVRNAALAVLIRRAKREGGAWVVGLAGVLLPGLRRLAGRLARDFPGDVADIDAEVLTGFLEALESVQPVGEHLAARLLWPAYRRARRLRLVEFENTLPRIPDQATGHLPARPWGHPDCPRSWKPSASMLPPMQPKSGSERRKWCGSCWGSVPRQADESETVAVYSPRISSGCRKRPGLTVERAPGSCRRDKADFYALLRLHRMGHVDTRSRGFMTRARLGRMRSPKVYADNASAMWTSLTPAAQASAEFVRIESPTFTRVILREPMPTVAIAELIDGTPTTKRTIVEDAFGAEPPLSGALQVRHMPVMIRPATQVAVVVPPDVRVAAVAEADELAEAERVMVDGFPLPPYQPWTRGQALPPRVLALPGWRVWLAYRDGLPAAAGYTYDDGVAVGVYWLATLHEHRSLGLGRAIMTVSMAAYPGRVFTLVATDAGLALYQSLGFATAAMSAWYVRPAATNR